MKSLSRVRLLPTPWTVAYQAPLSMGFSRQEYWSGVPLLSPDSEIRWRLSERAFCSTASESGNIKNNTKQNEIISALSAWHQSSQTWFFLNAQTLLPHCYEWQVFRGTEGPVWYSLPSFHTWPGDCEHPGAGLGNHVVHMHSHRSIHPGGQDALTSLGPVAGGVPSTSLLELQAQNWKPNKNPQKHFTLQCFQMFGELWALG